MTVSSRGARAGRVLTLAIALLSACSGPVASPGPTATAAAPKAAPVKVVARLRAGDAPCGVTAADGYVWISNFNDNTVVRVDSRTNTLVGRAVKSGQSPCGMGYGAGAVWTSDFRGGSTTRIDAQSAKVLASIPTGAQPYDAVFAAGSAWVSNYAADTVSKVDPKSGRVTAVPVGAGPAGLAVAGAQIWVANTRDGTVSRIDAARGAVIDTLTLGGTPTWTAYDDKHVWISDPPHATVSILDAATGALTTTVHLPAGVRPVDGAAQDGVAWIPDKNSGQIFRIDAGGAVTPYDTGLKGLFVVDVEDGSVWAADFAGTDVIRFSAANPTG